MWHLYWPSGSNHRSGVPRLVAAAGAPSGHRPGLFSWAVPLALVASVAPALVSRGLHAGELVKLAAQVTGGGGGGRDTMAQAGGRDPEKLDEALGVAREAIERALRS